MKILNQERTENWSLPIKCECIKNNNKKGYWDSNKLHCASYLEIDKDDIQYEYWHIGVEDGIDYIIECPVCGCIIEIDENKIPDPIKTYIFRKYIGNKENNKELS